MSEVVKRIIAWFAANVPRGHFKLRAGASEVQLSAAEQGMQLRLPDDVRESYLLHDGTEEDGAFFESYPLLPLDRMVLLWRRAMGFEGSEFPEWKDYVKPQGPIKKVMWNVRWVPIMEAEGDDILIDLDPAPGGSIGQVIERSHEIGPLRVLASNFREWLANYADDLENAKFQFDSISWNIARLKS